MKHEIIQFLFLHALNLRVIAARHGHKFIWLCRHPQLRKQALEVSNALMRGSAFLPCSHISEKNQMPLSPIQKSAGVEVILESNGASARSGLYSACQPKASPFQALPSV